MKGKATGKSLLFIMLHVTYCKFVLKLLQPLQNGLHQASVGSLRTDRYPLGTWSRVGITGIAPSGQNTL
jgi:hypothetical protein